MKGESSCWLPYAVARRHSGRQVIFNASPERVNRSERSARRRRAGMTARQQIATLRAAAAPHRLRPSRTTPANRAVTRPASTFCHPRRPFGLDPASMPRPSRQSARFDHAERFTGRAVGRSSDGTLPIRPLAATGRVQAPESSASHGDPSVSHGDGGLGSTRRDARPQGDDPALADGMFSETR